MNKPAFLKLLSTLMTMPVVSPVLAWALGEKLQNWAGNVEYTTERLYSQNSSEQVRDFVGKQAKLKVLGARHCFNGIADRAEHFVTRQRAIEAILAVERLCDRVGPHLMISEIRSFAADDFGMSPCYKAPRVTIHFTWKPDWSAVQHLLPIIERERVPLNALPHWGKLFTITPATLRAKYEKLSDFVDLCTRYDPKGKFRNEFLKRNIFALAS